MPALHAALPLPRHCCAALQIFSTYGTVQKVHIFEREGKTVALVQVGCSGSSARCFCCASGVPGDLLLIPFCQFGALSSPIGMVTGACTVCPRNIASETCRRSCPTHSILFLQ